MSFISEPEFRAAESALRAVGPPPSDFWDLYDWEQRLSALVGYGRVCKIALALAHGLCPREAVRGINQIPDKPKPKPKPPKEVRISPLYCHPLRLDKWLCGGGHRVIRHPLGVEG